MQTIGRDAIKQNRCLPRAKYRRGTAISLAVIVSVVITGLVITMAWAAGIQSSVAIKRTKSDEAFYAAEGALQWSIYELRQNPAWRPTGTSPVVNGWTCAISYTDLGSTPGLLGNPLKFTVVATKSGVQSSATTSGTVAGALAYVPQFWSVGDLTIAQSAHIDGDVETMGKLTINPPTSGPVQNQGVKGIVKASGIVVDNNPGPSGSGKYFTSAPVGNSTLTSPSMKAADVFNTLKSGPTVPLAACLVYVSGQPVIDFSKAGGKPVYYNGPASYVGSVGIINSSNPANDTFVIDAPGGVCNFTGTFPFNTAVAQMNLVINGNVTFNGSGSTGISIIGSFYVAGTWSQTGVYNFKGTVMTDGTTTLNGTGTVNVAVPPTFDPRYVPRVTSFTGVLP